MKAAGKKLMTPRLIPANQFTIEELTDAFNHTRVDYMVPMPMNVARLREYIHVYHVDLAESLVAVENDSIIGLGMLALRKNRSWITRLGLVARQRGKGIGELIMRGLLTNSDQLDIEKNMLEVIKGNNLAHRLFTKLHFKNYRELLILRRAPGKVPEPTTKAFDLEPDSCLSYLEKRQGDQAWTNQTESLSQVDGITGFKVELTSGRFGWMVFQRTKFSLTRLMFWTKGCDRLKVMKELLVHLHSKYPNLDTYTENISADDIHVPVFEQFGYFEAFRRIEMLRYPMLQKSQPRVLSRPFGISPECSTRLDGLNYDQTD
jgi:hypothetical protein